jgi:hypothetical protein
MGAFAADIVGPGSDERKLPWAGSGGEGQARILMNS